MTPTASTHLEPIQYFHMLAVSHVLYKHIWYKNKGYRWNVENLQIYIFICISDGMFKQRPVYKRKGGKSNSKMHEMKCFHIYHSKAVWNTT